MRNRRTHTVIENVRSGPSSRDDMSRTRKHENGPILGADVGIRVCTNHDEVNGRDFRFALHESETKSRWQCTEWILHALRG